MGGIVVRLLARDHPELVTGRVVMMAPPNQGSAIIDWLDDCRPARWILGPAGMGLATREVQEHIPVFPPDREVFVVMGRCGRVPLFRFLLRGENDGIVAVDEGRLSGTRRFDVMDVDHTFMMGQAGVLSFLTECLSPLPG
jgi:pimeloyl-ACP methyl ester carboxylesterase